ncbi:MAG: sigma-54-dependent Fis family transcriptional regulator [Deltaproteobacteria bacterium]|nr:sigma-54-dependent Fis family transcriptional regulator [Deltaproteobacteria bacterium]
MTDATPQVRERAASPVRVLLAEDDGEMRDLLTRVLRDEGYDVIEARDGTEALARLEEGAFDLVLSDVRMPGADGMDVLRRAMARSLHQPVILMTAFGTIEFAVQAMREGAYHYIAKPFNIDDLVEIAAAAAARVREWQEARGASAGGAEPFFPIVFRSEQMGSLLEMARQVAASTGTVLVSGASGTGTELLARVIHDLSPRHERPFVPVDVNAIPETLIESELFGHRRGSFTGAIADKQGLIELAEGGTLFLDEVGDLSPAVQGKLLRFLQERRFRRVGEVDERVLNVRLISATNKDLRALVAGGKFREDLFYRLSVIPLVVPDLRDRREDIAPLVYHFIRKHNAEYHVDGVRPDALDALVGYSWPGNVRQLENVVERAVILRKAGLIQLRDLPEEVLTEKGRQPAGAVSLEEMESRYIQQLMRECKGNQSQVARILGINRRTLYRKLRKPDRPSDE